jgi:hypothetical protein
MRKT